MDFTPTNYPFDPRPSNDGFFAESVVSYEHFLAVDHIIAPYEQHDFGHISDYETPALHIDEEWFQPAPEYASSATTVEPITGNTIDPNETVAPIYTTLFSHPSVADDSVRSHDQLNGSVTQIVACAQHMPETPPADVVPIPTQQVFNKPTKCNDKLFVCPDCDQSFQSKRSLSNHKRSHLIRTTFTCVLCEKEFSVRRQLQLHLRVHKLPSTASKTTRGRANNEADARKRFTCKICLESFDHRSLLDHHRTVTHEIKNNTQNNNSTPISTAINPRDPKKDSQTGRNHNRPAEVIKTNPDKGSVRCTHSDCSARFANVQLLRRHQTIHRLKRFQCSGCHREYHSKPVFRSHVRLCQPATDDCVLVADEDVDSGPIECRICGQLFENRRVLKFHRQFCSDEMADEEETRRVQELRANLGVEVAAAVQIKQELQDETDDK